MSICWLLPAMTVAAVSPPTPFAMTGHLAIRGAVPNATSLKQYAKLELTIDLSATYVNPFDPEEVDVWAEFRPTKGPPIRVNGFLFQPFARKLVGGKERIEPAGKPVWKVRFTPAVEGRWTYLVHAKDRAGSVSLKPAFFRVTRSGSPGFVRRSTKCALHFAFDNGKPFFAVGENMGWAGDRGTYDYDDWLPALGKAGGNWIRVWMSSWNCALEWSDASKGGNRRGTYYGVGVYSLDNAWKLDRILDEAERNGICTMVCFGTYGEFNKGGYFNEGQWPQNPYNAANGGPCAKPDDFWTNPIARKLYRQRLRYIAARYGCRTGVQSWEFWNEKEAPAPWVQEMAQFLKGTGPFAGMPADPYRHLVTNTYGNSAVWRIPEVDFTQSHHYGTGNVPDHATVIHSDAASSAVFGKPHLMAEFGIDWRDADRKYDPQGIGVNLHNGLWAAMASGNAGTGMLWWWDNYVHPLNLYGHFRPVRKFADSVAWSGAAWKPADVEVVASGDARRIDLVIPASAGWTKSAREYTIQSGGVKGSASLPQFFFGPAKPDMRTSTDFRLDSPAPTRFTIHVDAVSDRATLRLLLDGKPAREWRFAAAPPANRSNPEYKSTRLRPEYNSYEAKFDRDYSIDVPAGSHTVTLDVVEGDWLSVETYTVANYSRGGVADMQLYGLSNGRSAVLWAHNAAHNWKNVYDKKPIQPAHASEVVMRGLTPGPCTIEWWDTWKGVATRRERATVGTRSLHIGLPAIARDIAVRVYR